MRKLLSMVLISTCVGAGAGYAFAEHQPKMHEAKAHLEKALGALEAATADKGGHRAKAIELVKTAIGEVKEGIEFDNKH